MIVSSILLLLGWGSLFALAWMFMLGIPINPGSWPVVLFFTFATIAATILWMGMWTTAQKIQGFKERFDDANKTQQELLAALKRISDITEDDEDDVPF